MSFLFHELWEVVLSLSKINTFPHLGFFLKENIVHK